MKMCVHWAIEQIISTEFTNKIVKNITKFIGSTNKCII